MINDETEKSLGYPLQVRRTELLKAALDLPSEERERLAEALWVSLDGGSAEDVERAWAHELERRMDEADTGAVKAVPWSEVEAEALDAIRRTRGR
jgi:putative addiction module component (TIGR02574 family)